MDRPAITLTERQALALEADIARQIAMFNERLKPLNEVIHFTAPEGMAFTSGEHLQLAAADNVAINAGGYISTGSLGNTAVLAGEKLGLFAQNGKLSFISDQGPVQVQAQNGGLHISAAQKLSISSMSDILFAGKKKVTLIGGGSYVRIEAGGIEYGTVHTYTRNVKRTRKLCPEGQDIDFPLMGTSHIYSAVYQLQDEQGRILAGMPYHLKTPSGQEATGFSDAEGRTLAVYTREQEAVDLHVVQDKPQPEESMWFIGDGDQQQLTTEFREDV
ncbi:DUF2345 domain-containing protein [Erwinia papayae]|uniref:DUF2345 domain-containing protein n=1 Tax=Erwinia papayae TaxID=206499 RepID=A0ABV3N6T4_9GAMM